MGLAPGTLSKAGGSSSSAITAFDPHAGSSVSHHPGRAAVALTPCTQVTPTSVQQRLAAESLYRDANSLLYADNKPSEEAIDRVVGKINAEYVFVSDYTLACAQTCAVSTRKRSSRGNETTKRREISHISTSATKSSTRRFVQCSTPFRHFAHIFPRLLATTTSTRQRYARASSVARLYNCYPPSCCPTFCNLYTLYSHIRHSCILSNYDERRLHCQLQDDILGDVGRK